MRSPPVAILLSLLAGACGSAPAVNNNPPPQGPTGPTRPDVDHCDAGSDVRHFATEGTALISGTVQLAVPAPNNTGVVISYLHQVDSSNYFIYIDPVNGYDGGSSFRYLLAGVAAGRYSLGFRVDTDGGTYSEDPGDLVGYYPGSSSSPSFDAWESFDIDAEDGKCTGEKHFGLGVLP